jgi:hypothetical protein
MSSCCLSQAKKAMWSGQEKKKETSNAYSHGFEFFKLGITTHMLGLGE